MRPYIYYDNSSDDYEAWLELDAKYSGVCLGSGQSPAEAVASAEVFLSGIVAELRALPQAVDAVARAASDPTTRDK